MCLKTVSTKKERMNLLRSIKLPLTVYKVFRVPKEGDYLLPAFEEIGNDAIETNTDAFHIIKGINHALPIQTSTNDGQDYTTGFCAFLKKEKAEVLQHFLEKMAEWTKRTETFIIKEIQVEEKSHIVHFGKEVIYATALWHELIDKEESDVVLLSQMTI